MKFPKLHHGRILEIIKSNGFELEEFYLVKRKGWIRIEHQETSSFFTYFKKKETRLSETGQWENNVFFKVKINGGGEQIEPGFDSMMKLFDRWVKSLKGARS